MELVDSHTHLNDEKFFGREAEFIERARLAGVTRMINFGDTLESSKRAVDLAEKYEGVYAGVGVHPEEAHELGSQEDLALAEWARHPKVVAIGEIGLDYYWVKDTEQREVQKRVFVHQLDLARQLHLPVCIHDREAHGDTLSILKKEGRGLRGVLHCYSGSREMSEEFLALGFYLGVDGPLTFKNAAKLPEIVRSVPLERLLVETDAPYLAPVPKRGRQNEPAFVVYVAEKIAELKGISLEKVAEQTTANALALYGLQ